MSGMNTALVETLTAEVRVLKVGNRQITLSVFRQLDLVLPEEIAAFGRVRSGRTFANGGVEVVGRAVEGHPQAGTLVRSHMLKVYSHGQPIEGFDTSRLDPPRAWLLHALTVDRVELYDAWEDLPLIVLAGLR